MSAAAGVTEPLPNEGREIAHRLKSLALSWFRTGSQTRTAWLCIFAGSKQIETFANMNQLDMLGTPICTVWFSANQVRLAQNKAGP